jgi:hypothetical protein
MGRYLRQNALGLVAIFIALGGSAYAASQLPANSVGTKQLKKGAVTSSKVKADSITGSDLNMPSLGTVPSASNALALDGLSVSAFQRRVNGSCPANAAINQVNGDGSVGCQSLLEPPAAGFVVNATGGPVPVTESEEASLPLTGDTTWSAPANQVGLLMAQAKMRLATKTERSGPSEFEQCSPFVSILDNGAAVTGAGEFVSNHSPGAGTLTNYLSESSATTIGLVDPGTSHMITATLDGRGSEDGCAEGSTVEEVRIVVIPLGG